MTENDFLTVARLWIVLDFLQTFALRILDFLRICMENHSLTSVTGRQQLFFSTGGGGLGGAGGVYSLI